MKLLTILICVLCASGVVVADETQAGKTTAGSYAAEVTASQLHLRAGPTSSYQSVILVEKGRKLLVRRPAAGGWMVVEVPGGCDAWVAASFVSKDNDGMGTITANRLLVRPRPSTNFHQLSGSLHKGDTVKVLAEKQVGDTKWFQIRAPQRIALYCMGRYITKIGPASLAVAPSAGKSSGKSSGAATVAGATGVAGAKRSGNVDARFIVIEKEVVAGLARAKTARDLQPIRLTLSGIDGAKLSLVNQRRHIDLERKLMSKRDELVISDVELAQKGMLADLEKEIARIEEKYRKRIAAIEDERRAKRGVKGRYIATGVIEHKPDLLGRTPGFRITEGGKLRYFLIAPAYNLHQFRGKRVGITGILDRESGTGHFTVMVKRIEIISDK